jgi:hypothetical protein
MTALAPTLQAFFTTRLTNQYGASPHTSPPTVTPGGCCSATPHKRLKPRRHVWTCLSSTRT